MSRIQIVPAKTKVVEVEPARVRLDITLEEAQVIRALLGAIALSSNDTSRRLFGELADHLGPVRFSVWHQGTRDRAILRVEED